MLKNAERVDLAPIRAALAPAAVLLEDATDARRRSLALHEPWCHRSWQQGGAGGKYGHYANRSELTWDTVNWWGAMAAAWALVENYEAMQSPSRPTS